MQETLVQFLGWEVHWRRNRLSTPVFSGFPYNSAGKEASCNTETWVRSLGWEDPLKKRKATHSSIWPGEFHGLYSPWGCKKSDITEQLSLHFTLSFSIEGLLAHQQTNTSPRTQPHPPVSQKQHWDTLSHTASHFKTQPCPYQQASTRQGNPGPCSQPHQDSVLSTTGLAANCAWSQTHLLAIVVSQPQLYNGPMQPAQGIPLGHTAQWERGVCCWAS